MQQQQTYSINRLSNDLSVPTTHRPKIVLHVVTRDITEIVTHTPDIRLTIKTIRLETDKLIS